MLKSEKYYLTKIKRRIWLEKSIQLWSLCDDNGSNELCLESLYSVLDAFENLLYQVVEEWCWHQIMEFWMNVLYSYMYHIKIQ